MTIDETFFDQIVVVSAPMMKMMMTTRIVVTVVVMEILACRHCEHFFCCSYSCYCCTHWSTLILAVEFFPDWRFVVLIFPDHDLRQKAFGGFGYDVAHRPWILLKDSCACVSKSTRRQNIVDSGERGNTPMPFTTVLNFVKQSNSSRRQMSSTIRNDHF